MSVDNAFGLSDAMASMNGPMSHTTDLLDFLNDSDPELDVSEEIPTTTTTTSNNDEAATDDAAANTKETDAHSDAGSANEDSPSLTLCVTNVVVVASMRCHLRLKEMARVGVNVEYKALQNHVIMRIRSPYTVATIWSSGKIWCTGANSLIKAKIGARRIARRISKCGFPCRFSKYRVVNIMATCHLPFRVRLEELVKERPMLMSYEPELSPGLTFKTDPNSSTLLKLFSTGRVVLMGPSMENIGALLEEVVPLAALHQTDEPVSDSDREDTPKAVKHKSPVIPDRPVSTRRMFVLPGELPSGCMDGYMDDEDDDYARVEEGSSDEYSLDEEWGEREPGQGKRVYSTDDSTDSGASVDSEGVRTRPKRRRKRMKHSHRKSRTQDFMPIGSADDLGGVTVSSHHPSMAGSSWCRRTVASGSTKRACITTYSGNADSSEQNNESNPPLQPIPAIPIPARLPPIATNIGVMATTAPPTIINSAQPVIAAKPMVNLHPASPAPAQQFVIVSGQQPLTAQSIQFSQSAPIFQMNTTPTMSTTPQGQIIRLAAPTSMLGLATNQNGCIQSAPTTTAYPVRMPMGAMHPTTVMPTIQGTKMANPAPQFIHAAYAPGNTPQTAYQFIPQQLIGQTATFCAAPQHPGGMFLSHVPSHNPTLVSATQMIGANPAGLMQSNPMPTATQLFTTTQVNPFNIQQPQVRFY